MKVTIFNNPKCSKCRAAMSYLQEHQIETEVVAYLEGKVTEQELKEVLAKLGMTAAELVRTKETLWQEQYAGRQLSEDEIVRILVQHPQLIERPIVIYGDKAVVARQTERLTELLG